MLFQLFVWFFFFLHFRPPGWGNWVSGFPPSDFPALYYTSAFAFGVER